MSYGLELINKKPLVFTMPRTPRDVYGLGDNHNIIDLQFMGRVVENRYTLWGWNDFKNRNLRPGTYLKIEPKADIRFRASLHSDNWFRLDQFELHGNTLVVEPLRTTPASNNSYGLYVNGRYLESDDLVLQKAYKMVVGSSSLGQLQSYIEGKYILITPLIKHLRDNFEKGRPGKIPEMEFGLYYTFDRYGRAYYQFISRSLTYADLNLAYLSFEGSNL